MAKTKKTSGKKKDRVKALIQLGETATKMASRNDELMTVAGINTFTKNAESIDSIEKLENIIGMEPPKETLWCRTIDVSNGNNAPNILLYSKYIKGFIFNKIKEK